MVEVTIVFPRRAKSVGEGETCRQSLIIVEHKRKNYKLVSLNTENGQGNN